MSGDYNEAVGAAAEIVDAECERILSKQSETTDESSINCNINSHLRMMACILPDVAANIRALHRPDDAGDDGWRTIESAPTGDDDFFLVCGIGDPRSPFVVRGSIMKSARKSNTPAHLSLGWLTHWRPLPAPPATEGK